MIPQICVVSKNYPRMVSIDGCVIKPCLLCISATVVKKPLMLSFSLFGSLAIVRSIKMSEVVCTNIMALNHYKSTNNLTLSCRCFNATGKCVASSLGIAF